MILNQILFSKPWYIDQIYTITIPSGTIKKYNLLDTWLSSPLEGWTGYFRHKHSIKFSKNKMDSKIIKFYQFSLKISHTV